MSVFSASCSMESAPTAESGVFASSPAGMDMAHAQHKLVETAPQDAAVDCCCAGGDCLMALCATPAAAVNTPDKVMGVLPSRYLLQAPFFVLELVGSALFRPPIFV